MTMADGSQQYVYTDVSDGVPDRASTVPPGGFNPASQGQTMGTGPSNMTNQPSQVYGFTGYASQNLGGFGSNGSKP